MNPSPKKNLGRKILVNFVLLALAAVVVSGFAGALGTRRNELDVNSGRLRRQIRMFGIAISEKIVDMPFSRLAEEHGLITVPPDFRYASSAPSGIQRFFGGSLASGFYNRANVKLHSIAKSFELCPDIEPMEHDVAAQAIQYLRNRDLDGLEELLETLNEAIRVHCPDGWR